MKMTIQTLFDAWKVSGVHHLIYPTATDADIKYPACCATAFGELNRESVILTQVARQPR